MKPASIHTIIIASTLAATACTGTDEALGDPSNPSMQVSLVGGFVGTLAPVAPRIGVMWMTPTETGVRAIVGQTAPLPSDLSNDANFKLVAPPDDALIHFVDAGANPVATVATARLFAFDDRDGDNTIQLASPFEAQGEDTIIGIAWTRQLTYWALPPTGATGNAVEAPSFSYSAFKFAGGTINAEAPEPGFELVEPGCPYPMLPRRTLHRDTVPLTLFAPVTSVRDPWGCHADVVDEDLVSGAGPTTCEPGAFEAPPPGVTPAQPGDACDATTWCAQVCCVCPNGRHFGTTGSPMFVGQACLAGGRCADAQTTCALAVEQYCS